MRAQTKERGSLLPKLPVVKLPVPSVRAISANNEAATFVDIFKSDELFRMFTFLNVQLLLFIVLGFHSPLTTSLLSYQLTTAMMVEGCCCLEMLLD
jgi:hypothetical protein